MKEIRREPAGGYQDITQAQAMCKTCVGARGWAEEKQRQVADFRVLEQERQWAGLLRKANMHELQEPIRCTRSWEWHQPPAWAALALIPTIV
jgi:hypothetical protein